MQFKSITLGLLALVLALQVPANAATASQQPKSELALDVYARPAQRVDIGQGRHLNMRCAGSGSPTILLESGANADSLVWQKLQPLLAGKFKVCSYDRAGYGFSDKGPLPRDLRADVADLHALVLSAKLAAPLILVGHSLGSNIVRRYAELYPNEVAGLVLIDPPAQNIAAFSAEWAKAEQEGQGARFAFLDQCMKAADAHQLEKPSPAVKDCIRPANPVYSVTLNAAIRANKSRPAYWHTLNSELHENIALFQQPMPANESHGALPLIVLTAEDAYADVPPNDRRALEAARDETHKLIAATSTRGERMIVAHSTHEIQTDQPKIVADAVFKLAAEIRAEASRSAAPPR